jgi:hypothetical protein
MEGVILTKPVLTVKGGFLLKAADRFNLWHCIHLLSHWLFIVILGSSLSVRAEAGPFHSV